MTCFRPIVLFSVALLAAACGGSSAPAQPDDDVVLASAASLGSHLATKGGRTLYYFTLDAPAAGANAPTSNCNDADCLAAWPVFHASASLAAGLNAADFTEFTRADGTKQTAYKGWPLYTFSGDVKSGDLNGENVDKQWFVLKDPFYTVLIGDKPSLHFLATGTERAFYMFKNDTPGSGATPPTSACTSAACAATWPAYYSATFVVPTGVDASDFTTFKRPDGSNQTAYKGHPLYIYSGDANPGDTKGNNFANLWFLVDPTK